MACKRIVQKTLVRNTGATTNTGTASGRVRGLSSLLHLHLSVAFVPDNKKRLSSYAGNVFSVYGWVETEDGEFQLDGDPINNDFAGNQQAPGAYEGSTGLDAVSCSFAYTGLNAAGAAGKWVLVARVEPAVPMSDELFAELADSVTVSVDNENLSV